MGFDTGLRYTQSKISSLYFTCKQKEERKEIYIIKTAKIKMFRIKKLMTQKLMTLLMDSQFNVLSYATDMTHRGGKKPP